MEKKLLTYVAGLISLTLVLFLPACRKDNNTLKSEKDEIIRKAKVFLDMAEPDTIRSIYEILDKANLENIGRGKMFLVDFLRLSYPFTWVVADGSRLEAWFPSDFWDSMEIMVLSTVVPREMVEGLESEGSVGETTQGTLTLSYTDTNGKPVEVKRIIEIDNRKPKISYKGSTVTMLKQIFEPLPSPLGGQVVSLFMDFSYWVTISLKLKG